MRRSNDERSTPAASNWVTGTSLSESIIDMLAPLLYRFSKNERGTACRTPQSTSYLGPKNFRYHHKPQILRLRRRKRRAASAQDDKSIRNAGRGRGLKAPLYQLNYIRS
jgi:hypothetical protein